MHSPFPWTLHPHTPTAVFDADGKRIVDQWVAPDGWLPIETAPTSDEVLASGYIRDKPEYGRWSSIAIQFDGAWFDVSTDEKLYQPTHWRPLPAPPSDKPAPAPLDPETAADNAALIAAIPAMVEKFSALIDALDIYRFSPDGSVEASHAASDLDDALDEAKAVLASIGRVK